MAAYHDKGGPDKGRGDDKPRRSGPGGPRKFGPRPGGGSAGPRKFERGEGGPRKFERGQGGPPKRFDRGEGGPRKFERKPFERGEGGPRKFDRGEGGPPKRFDRGEGGPRKFERKPFERGEGGPRKFDRGEGGPPKRFDRGEGGPRKFERKPFERGEGGPRKFDRGEGGPPKRFDRGEGGPRKFERKPFERGEGGPRKFDRGEGGPRKFERRDGERKPFERREGGPPKRFDRGEGGPRKFERRDGERKPFPRRDGSAPRPPRSEREPNHAAIQASKDRKRTTALQSGGLLLQLGAELMFDFRHAAGAADEAIGTYIRARKFLGPNERNFLGDTFFHVLRHLRRYDESIQSAFSGLFVADTRFTSGFPVTAEVGAKAWRAESTMGTPTDGEGQRQLVFDRIIDTLRVGLAAVERELLDTTQLATEVIRAWPELTGRNAPGPEAIEHMVKRAAELADQHAADTKPIHAARRHSFPDWLWGQLGFGRAGDELDALASALNRPAVIALRVNTLKTNAGAARAALEGHGIEAVESPLVPGAFRLNERAPRQSLPEFREGWFEFQDEGSQLVALFCGVRPGMTVVDACAGGGGKTIHLGALMENDGTIHAMDIDPDRMEPLVRRAGRAGLSIHSLGHRYAADGSIVTAPEAADLVLLDVPCSGTGVLRRNPENRWRLSHERLESLRHTQQRLLDMWAPRVRPGGVLVYATCSLLDVENAMQVDAFLERHPEFTREAPEGFAGPVDPRGDLRTAPHTEGCDGFYAARLRRRG